MKVASSSEKFIVPREVFDLLDPIEKIVIKAQAARGDVVITEATK
jgi:CxxC motif-containing protein